MNIKNFITVALSLLLFSCQGDKSVNLTPVIKVSEDGHFLQGKNGDPFFWLGDTGWLLFKKLNHEEAVRYLNDRKQKGFNVIQVMVIHNVKGAVNCYGDSAIVNSDVSQPLVTDGNSHENPEEYDYWDHVDYIVKLAQERGIYIGMVPVWGSNVRGGNVTREQAVKYAEWLSSRYRNYNNIIWLNGGDVKGSDSLSVWNAIGTTIKMFNPDQLVTFHSFGRTRSSEWFHNESWLDFNMFQSGHRRYDQDTSGLAFGEDNWRYTEADYEKIPVKPILDGEPSYEGIPQGLHDPSQPYWTDADVRRYAYWSVFAGGCGFTYGHNAIMQFHREDDMDSAYGVRETWVEALNSPGAEQMIFLKNLILSKPYFERVPAQELLAGPDGVKYDHIAVTRGNDYVFAYTYTGREIGITSSKLNWKEFRASWYDPRNGSVAPIGRFDAGSDLTFDPPGEPSDGNDWVLVLEEEPE
jgi:hypothetical protein